MERHIISSSRITFAGLSDIGVVRARNEDVWGAIEEISFFCLADGMGGHQAGDVASREALSELISQVRGTFSGGGKSLLQSCELMKRIVGEVNAKLYHLSKSSNEYRGMGTTLVSILFHNDGAIISNVGDSRIYRESNGECRLLTKDHSLFREILEMGRGLESWPSDFSYKNVLTMAVGTDAKIDPAVTLSEYLADDIFLLCSDGLTDALSTAQIGRILRGPESEHAKAEELILQAKKGGSVDNISAIVIRLHA